MVGWGLFGVQKEGVEGFNAAWERSACVTCLLAESHFQSSGAGAVVDAKQRAAADVASPPVLFLTLGKELEERAHICHRKAKARGSMRMSAGRWWGG